MDQILIEKPSANSAELSSSLDETLLLKVRKKRKGEDCSPRHRTFRLPKLNNPPPATAGENAVAVHLLPKGEGTSFEGAER